MWCFWPDGFKSYLLLYKIAVYRIEIQTYYIGIVSLYNIEYVDTLCPIPKFDTRMKRKNTPRRRII